MHTTPVRPLRSEADYEAALKEFEGYFDNEPAEDSEEADRFELLGIVLATYEELNEPIAAPSPIEALKFRMEHSGRSQADLAAVLGSRSRASEILSGRRSLTLDQIRKLHREWRIPVASLVGDLETA